jgi:NADPH:quinone reductase-like Zn-dependent oxidoreductase
MVLVSSGLDAAEAVSLVLNYITAYQMLLSLLVTESSCAE